jgi:hypothetical protein
MDMINKAISLFCLLLLNFTSSQGQALKLINTPNTIESGNKRQFNISIRANCDETLYSFDTLEYKANRIVGYAYIYSDRKQLNYNIEYLGFSSNNSQDNEINIQINESNNKFDYNTFKCSCQMMI